jgi:signal transduction histidine kinase
VDLTYSPEAVSLVIQDNGIGFQAPRSPAELANEGHFGLLGIAERADLIGAVLEIQSTPGKGTLIKIRRQNPDFAAAEGGLGENA